ncbi:MAG: rod shape-determining protein [Candidatus Magnetoovum sp. WYHC-5]|nr:rod shape-determining protein [Candidatus Magnetoovum sp. WYHC-5]
MSKINIVNMGIDLGTSRTVIACDNGVRAFVPSIVGFPKDAVSQKLFGKNVVVGEEALKHRMALNIIRPFERGVVKFSDEGMTDEEYNKSIEAARLILEHMVNIAKEGAIYESDQFIVRGVLGAPALASIKNKKALLDVARGILDDVLVASEPFTVAYGLGLLTNALIIDIGAGTVDICRMHGVIPTEEDQITTTKAGDYVDGVFFNLIKKKYPDVNLTLNMVKRFKEENATISEHGEKIYIEVPVKGKPERRDVTEELKQACRSIVPDIVKGVEGLIASFDPEFQSGLKENVILAGGGSQIIGLKKEIEDYMNKTLGYGRVIKIEEPLFAGANGALLLCKDMPDEYWHELKSRDSKKL